MQRFRKLIEGWEPVIALLVMGSCWYYDKTHNGGALAIATMALSALGLAPDVSTVASWTNAAPQILTGVVAFWGILTPILVARRQQKAGASPTELLSPEGYVKQVVAEEEKKG